MDIKKLQTVVVDALEDVKGQDIVLFDTTGLTSLFDRIAVVSGTSNRQTKALAASVRDKVKAAGGDVIGLEGEDTGEWVLVDLGDMIVHIMQPAIRQYYRLEEIWGEKPVKLGAAKRKSTAGSASKPPRPKVKSKHLAANQDQPEAKPVRERKPPPRRLPRRRPPPRSRRQETGRQDPDRRQGEGRRAEDRRRFRRRRESRQGRRTEARPRLPPRPPKAPHRPRKSSSASRRPTSNLRCS
jgi:ribosome-associated protein